MSNAVLKNFALGIDLGSNHCRAAYYYWDAIHYAADAQTGDWIPSYVSYAEKPGVNIQPVSVGKLAKYQWVNNLSNVIYDIKRLMGRTMDDPVMSDDLYNFKIPELPPGAPPCIEVTVGGKKEIYSPEEVASHLFWSFKTPLVKKLIDDSIVVKTLEGANASDIQIKVERAVIAIPPHFNNRRRRSVLAAGRMVFQEVRLVHDTTAAAYNFWKEGELPAGKYHLIYNFGHSSVDCTIVKVFDGKLTALAHGSSVDFGGRSITILLMNHLKETYRRRHKRELVLTSNEQMKLWLKCQKMKKILTHYESTRFYYAEIYLETSEYQTVTRSLINGFIVENSHHIQYPIKNALNDAGLTKEEIDRVICIGNGSKTPKIKKMVERFFNGRDLQEGEQGKDVTVSECESDVVRGTALIAGEWDSSYGPDDRRLPAVFVGGDPAPIIPRNSLNGKTFHKTIVRGKFDEETILYESIDDGNRTPLMATVTPRGDVATIEYRLSIDHDGIVTNELGA